MRLKIQHSAINTSIWWCWNMSKHQWTKQGEKKFWRFPASNHHSKHKGNLRFRKTQITNLWGFLWMESRESGDEQREGGVWHHRLGPLFQTDFSCFLQPSLFCPPATTLCSNHKHFHTEEGSGYLRIGTFWELISMSPSLFATSRLCISIVKKKLSPS